MTSKQFMERWADAEARGAEIRVEAAAAQRGLAPLGRDRSWYPGRLSIEKVVAERIRLAIFDPEGEEELDEPFKVLRWYHGIR